MASEAEITQILTSDGGKVRGLGTTAIRAGSNRVPQNTASRIDALCWDATSAINTAASTIEFRAVAQGTLGADAVIVGNAAEWAATGVLVPPGLVYSDFFSGCLFFLFRDTASHVVAVHSFRQSGTYANPIPYFTQRGAKLLYYFDSRGVFTPMGPNVFGSVIVNVSANRLVIDFFAMQNDGTVVQVVDHQAIDNWTTHEIGDPGIVGALGLFQPLQLVQAPAQVGLKQRVANFFLNFIK
jgi:hypothetical protein